MAMIVVPLTSKVLKIVGEMIGETFGPELAEICKRPRSAAALPFLTLDPDIT
jgi:hypothetical protein